MLSQKALHTVVCMLWMLWLLVLQPGLAAATQHQDQQQQHATGSSVTRNMQQAQLMRALLADTKLYCNITSECKPCLPKHLDSEACRPTAYTEHLTCSTSAAHKHETMLTIRRRLSPRTTLLHVSRSCRAPTEAVATSKASSSSSSDSDSDGNKDSSSSSSKESSTREVPLSEQVMQHGSSSSGSSSVDSKEADGSKVKSIALSGAAKALYPLSAVGGLNLLYFELAMLVILSGALPIVYVRKRRFVR